jgi:hypothetical protein
LETFALRKHQPRLADAGFTRNEGDMPAPLLYLPPARQDKIQFLVAADERSDPCAVERFKSAFGLSLADHTPGLEGFGEALK